MQNIMNIRSIPRFRKSLFLGDFKEARRFATFILDKTLHDKNQTDYVRLLHSAFNTSLIISYCRPFTFNRNRPGEDPSSLKMHVEGLLTNDEVDLHKVILERRNQVYAHTQASARLFEGMDYDKSLFFTKSVGPLSKQETRMLKRMIKKWIDYLRDSMGTNETR
jgi:hypothetical protein